MFLANPEADKQKMVQLLVYNLKHKADLGYKNTPFKKKTT